jgi:SAM-dependent methyltransferase
MDWQPYVLSQSFDFPQASVVLDIGCGVGNQLAECSGRLQIGIEPNPASARKCRERGFPTLRAKAEQLPFTDNSFDRIICKVVLPYTVEDSAISEISRVLKPGGKCILIAQGPGYYFRYLLLGSIKLKIYAARALVNTWLWALCHTRLPGLLGDTTYQSDRRLTKYFNLGHLAIVSKRKTRFAGLVVFSYLEVIKRFPSTRNAPLSKTNSMLGSV